MDPGLGAVEILGPGDRQGLDLGPRSEAGVDPDLAPAAVGPNPLAQALHSPARAVVDLQEGLPEDHLADPRAEAVAVVA